MSTDQLDMEVEKDDGEGLRAHLSALSLAGRSEKISYTALAYAFGALEREPEAPLTLSICLPFCPSIDLTCDRVAVAGHEQKVVEAYLNGIYKEIALVAAKLGDTPRLLSRVHIHGPSPNYLSEIALAHLFTAINDCFDLWDGTKVSFELDPRRASRSQLNFLKGLEVKDLHLQVRDLDPIVQGEIGRVQSLELLKDVIDISRDAGFESIGIDQVYGLPGQSVASFEKSIDSLISLCPDWVECNVFVKREKVFPNQNALNERQLPSLADKLAMYEALTQRLQFSGFQPVGLSLFSQANHALATAQVNGSLSLNILGFSPQPQSWVIGVGLGAMSELPGMIVQNHTSLDIWQKMIDDNFLTVTKGVLDDSDHSECRIILRQLMCNQLVAYEPVSDVASHVLHPLIESGFVALKGSALSVTELGREFLPQLLSDSSPAYRSV